MSRPSGIRPSAGGSFATTEWTLVRAATEADTSEGQEALARLCSSYWQPLYAFVRRRGYGAAAAEDLTQGFFATMLEKSYLAAADREKGKFRTFLLAALKNYLAKEWDRSHAVKRGGDKVIVSLDVAAGERGDRLAATEEPSPEEAFDHSWAIVQLEPAVACLEEEMSATPARFEALRPFLTGEGDGTSYRDVAGRLEVSEGAVKVAVHRMRKRFGELLRREVARTVSRPEQIDEEIRHLLAVVRL